MNVACLEWKLDDLLRHEVVAEGSVLSVDRNRTRTGLHRYHLVHLADLHLDRDVGRASDQGLHLVQDLLAEPGNLYLQRIIAGRDQLKTERTRLTCNLRTAEIGGRVLEGHVRAGKRDRDGPRADQQVPHDEQTPALADHFHGPGNAAVLAVGAHDGTVPPALDKLKRLA